MAPRVADVPELRSRLLRCCLDSLPHFYLPEAGILAESRVWDGECYRATGPSVRNTANVLLALYHLRARGMESALDADRILERCVADHLQACGFPEIAFLLWADAVGNRTHAARLWAELTRRLPDGASDTMLVSWALCGACAHARTGRDRPPIAALARNLRDRILGNRFPATGLFFASGARHGLFRRRKPTASLSAQVFAILALAQYIETFGDAEAEGAAIQCADRLCGLQGPRGQWFWSYDVCRGTVAEEYPIYSVNQDGAMPAALSMIGRAARDRTYERATDRGLSWVFGDNELESSMLDERHAVILRGIRREAEGFEIMREMRSYHAGRCLYWLAVSEPA
jgi:hypothetical protein